MTAYELRTHIRTRHGLVASGAAYNQLTDLHRALHRDGGADHEHDHSWTTRIRRRHKAKHR